MKFVFLFCKWLFTMSERSGLEIEIISDKIRIRGGNCMPLPDRTRDEVHHWITKEAARLAVPFSVQMEEDGIYISHVTEDSGDDTKGNQNEGQDNSSMQ